MAKLKNTIVDALATAGFVGRIGFAPGTWGTLWGIPLALAFAAVGPTAYLVLTLVFIFFSIVVAQLWESLHQRHDAGEVVIDEVAGYLVAFTWLPLHWVSFACAFLLFRLFDIWKPFPISWLDRRVGGGLGVVVDDLAAGLLANVILQFVVYEQLLQLIEVVQTKW